MKNPPAFQLYAQDFIADANVTVMDAKELGMYFKLLLHCWIEDGLLNDEDYLKELSKGGSTTVQPWDQAWLKVRRCFYQKNGKLRNRRLDRERQKQAEWREKSAEGGRKSAESKRNKRLLKGGSKGGLMVVQPKVNSSSSSSLKNKSRDLYIDETEFIQFWESYPNKEAKDVAFDAFKTLRKKESLETIAKAFNGYIDFLKNEQIRNNFDRRPMNASTFLRKNRWKDFLDFKYEAPL